MDWKLELGQWLLKLDTLLPAKLHPSLSVDIDFQSWIQGWQDDPGSVVISLLADYSVGGPVEKVAVPLDKDAPGLDPSVELFDRVVDPGPSLVATIMGCTDSYAGQKTEYEKARKNWQPSLMEDVSAFLHKLLELSFHPEFRQLSGEEVDLFELGL